MRYRFSILVVAYIFLSLISSLHAQSWQRVFGPYGGDVQGIASDRFGHVFAGTDSGMYVTSDRGLQWNAENNGLLEREIYALSASPTGSLFAATEGRGVFRTTDYGTNWTARNHGLIDSAFVITVATDRAGNVYAGSSVTGIYFSSDEGANWSLRSNGMHNTNVWSITISPTGEIYAGTTGFIMVSTNQGVQWTVLDSIGPTEEVLSLGTDSNGVMVAGTSKGMIYRYSPSGAITWHTFNPATSPIECVGFDQSTQTFFAGSLRDGMFKSTSSGLDWTHYNDGLTDTGIYSVTVTPAGGVYIGTLHAQVFRLPGAGESVQTPHTNPSSLVIYPEPIHNRSSVEFTLSNGGLVDLDLYTLSGIFIRRVMHGWFPEGKHSVTMEGSGLRSGSYCLALRENNTIEWKRIVVLR